MFDSILRTSLSHENRVIEGLLFKNIWDIFLKLFNIFHYFVNILKFRDIKQRLWHKSKIYKQFQGKSNVTYWGSEPTL